MEIFTELSIIILIATLFAMLMKFLKQPLIVGYILAGIIAGPYALNILRSTEQIELFSKIGITVLLFIVGLSLSPKVIKEVGKVSLVTGVGQVLFTSVIGFAIALVLGIDRIAAFYVAIALTFSSTIIILKHLSDRGDLNKLYGKISIGFLLVQDIIATIILLLISSFAANSSVNIYSLVGILLLKGLIVFITLYIVSVYVMPKVSKFLASSQELLFLFSITWGFGIAALFQALGFSVEIGALIAGVALSLTPFSYEIGSRMKPLRDFFIVLFFILLGSQLVIDNVGVLIIPAIVLSIFVLIGNPIIVVILMNLMGYKRRTGYMAGLTVAQISEFSLILAVLGFNLGHLSREILSLITLVGLITIAGSTYFILYADKIYPKIEKLLKLLELRKIGSGEVGGMSEKYEIILFGYDRVGQDFINAFKKIDRDYLIIDFNPESIEKLRELGIPSRFGDAQDPEFIKELSLDKVRLVVSTIPDFKTNILLTKKVKEENHRTIIIMIAQDIKEAEDLYENGATYVVMPHYLGARHVAKMIQRYGFDKSEFILEKERHIESLSKRKS